MRWNYIRGMDASSFSASLVMLVALIEGVMLAAHLFARHMT